MAKLLATDATLRLRRVGLTAHIMGSKRAGDYRVEAKSADGERYTFFIEYGTVDAESVDAVVKAIQINFALKHEADCRERLLIAQAKRAEAERECAVRLDHLNAAKRELYRLGFAGNIFRK